CIGDLCARSRLIVGVELRANGELVRDMFKELCRIAVVQGRLKFLRLADDLFAIRFDEDVKDQEEKDETGGDSRPEQDLLLSVLIPGKNKSGSGERQKQ